MKFRNLIPLLLAAVAGAGLAAESPQEFAARIEKADAVHPVVNIRNDGSFGSVSIGVQPAFVADRTALEPVLAEIGKYAAGSRLKIDVLSPTREDVDFIVGKLSATGVKKISTRVMAAGVSIQVTRIFLTPDASQQEKPPARAEPPAEKPAAPAPKKK